MSSLGDSVPSAGPPRYIEPGRIDRVFNRLTGWLTRRGLSLAGSRVLAVRGRTSGELRTIPVNVLTVDSQRYLVAPRGVTQWVRNLRAAGGEGELRLGRKVERFQAVEVADADKDAILRAYLDRWKWEVGRFFEDSDDIDPAAFPVFRLD